MKKVLSLILVISMFLSFAFALSGCGKDPVVPPQKEKKAIIITHGIGQGCLYNADTNEPFYCIPSLDSEGLANIIPMVEDLNRTLVTLKLKEDGTSNVNLRGTTMDDADGRFFMLSMAKPLYDALKAAYGNSYDVITWGYDWRKDNRDSAAELEAYINQKGYDKVVLTAHSMGGNIIADYLSRSAANRDKCEMFIPIGSPFFGSADTYYFMYSGIFPNLNDILKGSEFEGVATLGNLNTIVESVGITPVLMDVISNCPSLYQIFPSRAMLDDPNKPAEAESEFCLDGYYYDYDETTAHFAEEYSYSITADGQAKLGLRDMEDYQLSNYIDVNGTLTHVTGLVNTQFIVGSNCNTPYAISVSETNDGYSVVPVNYTYGDAIVPMYSATAGTDYDAENVHLFEGRTHLTIITDPDVIAKVVELVGTIK